MNLRQKYKKAKRELDLLKNTTIKPLNIKVQQMDILPVAVQRLVQKDDLKYFDIIKKDMAKQLGDGITPYIRFTESIDEIIFPENTTLVTASLYIGKDDY